MAFWSRWLGNEQPNHVGITPNDTPGAPAPESRPHTVGVPDWRPGDPDGLQVDWPQTFSRGLPVPTPSPWDGWPAGWSTPAFNGALGGFNRLVDTAWAAIDLNARVLAAMPVYRMAGGQVVEPAEWMGNPDPLIYSSWYEFMHQLVWDYMLGEAFVLAMSRDPITGLPRRFRVIPPWLINVEMSQGYRTYSLGGEDVTRAVLHIRYQSDTANARGRGPLDAAGARITTAALLGRYVERIAETGGIPLYWLEINRTLTQAQANDLLDTWIESRRARAGQPALVTGGAVLKQSAPVSAKDMTLLELAQFSEARISTLCGVPPFLVGLPSGGDSLTYSTIAQLFDYHDRASLKPKVAAIMPALSAWTLPAGETAELNRDEYTRPDFASRAAAYRTLLDARDADGQSPLSAGEVRAMERFTGYAAAGALTGDESNNANNAGESDEQPATRDVTWQTT